MFLLCRWQRRSLAPLLSSAQSSESADSRSLCVCVCVICSLTYPPCSQSPECWQQSSIHGIFLNPRFFHPPVRSWNKSAIRALFHHAADWRWGGVFLGGVSAGDVRDEERHGGLSPHRIPLRLHGDVPLSSGACGPGRTRPAAQGSFWRRPGGGAPRREPRCSGEHAGSDQRGQTDIQAPVM